jgi:Protein of unknown function (DUF3224)
MLLAACSVAAVCFLQISPARTQNTSTYAVHKENSMSTTHATGTFDVKVQPQAASEFETANTLARYSLDKEIHGEMEGTSKGEMLTTSEANGLAVYVALERVTATLNGRAGTFLLQHNASMTKTSQQMQITVVPDSGTGQLIGISGTFTIKIVEKKHFYDFAYTLPTEN